MNVTKHWYAQCVYAECSHAICAVVLSVILCVAEPNVAIMLSVVMVIVMAPQSGLD